MSNKKKDVAETPVEAPPAAAYPDSPTTYPDSSGSASSGHDYAATNSASSAPAPAPSAPNTPVFQLRAGEQLITHSIERGDTLGGIASHYNSSQSRIMAANGMTSTKIIAGKTLQVPTSAPPADLAMNGAGAGAGTTPASSGSYPAPASASPYSRAGSYSAPSASPYSPPAPVAPAPVTPPTTYGSGSYGSSTTGGSYPSPTSAPAPAPVQPDYSTNAPSPPVVPANPSSTSFPRVQTAPAPPQAGGAFPTPNLSSGSGQVQFSN